MPMTFTDAMVAERAAWMGIEAPPEQLREAVALAVEAKSGDFVEAWEIRTGRPWDQMTREEAAALIVKHPQCSRNFGVLSRLHTRSAR